MANPIKSEPERIYGSDELLPHLSAILATHRAVKEDFPASSGPLAANLRALQSALPAAIAEVEAAMKEADEED